jgi:large subunit ribosomal protein L22
MTGPKTNEGVTTVGQRTGTRSVARYVRASAYKAREVLDLIRGLEVAEADGILQFVERDIAIVVRKCLASAVANAQHNEQQDPDELYVSACFADEGPTLKRFRPRARGRAGRIRKRTCHITILVSRLPEAELEKRRRREEAKPSAGRARRGAASAAAARRERVARSRQAAAERAAAQHDHEHDHDTDATADTEPGGQVDTTTTEASETRSERLASEATAPEGLSERSESERSGAGGEASEASGEQARPYPGSHAPLADGDDAPDGYDIKGNAQSMLYHVPGSRFYKATKAEVWFASEEAAEAAGFQKPPSQRGDDSGDASGDSGDASGDSGDAANDTEEDA